MATTVDQKLLKQTKFPAEFNNKVDMRKVNVEVMKKWITRKISEILGTDDDIVTELCFNLLDGERYPNIKVLQIQLTGFLEKDTAAFCKELWSLCLSAQANPQGVPKELLEAKKQEILQEKLEAEKAAEQARRRRQHDDARDTEIDNIRQTERMERGHGRWRGSRIGTRDRDFDRRSFRRSPSPQGHGQDSRWSRPARGDTYVPRGRGSRPNQRGRSPTASRSPSARSISRTPPRRRSPPRRGRSPSPARNPPRRRRHPPSRSPSHSREQPPRRNNESHIRHSSPPRKRNLRSPSPRRHRFASRSSSRGRSSPRARSRPDKRRRQRYSESSSRSPPLNSRQRSPHARANERRSLATTGPQDRNGSTQRRKDRSISRSQSASPAPSRSRRRNSSSIS